MILKKFYHIIFQRFFSRVKFIIIDHNEEDALTFLCYGTRAFFKKNLIEAIFDDKLIAGLWPEQACFLGILFGEQTLKNNFYYNYEKYKKKHTKTSGHFHSLINNEVVFDRKGQLIYTDKTTGQVRVDDPILVASKKELINQFTPSVACSIGVFVGKNIGRLQNGDKQTDKTPDITTGNKKQERGRIIHLRGCKLR